MRWDPSYAFGHVALSATHYFSNEWREARASYLAALRLAPFDPEVLRYIPPSGTGHVEDDVAIGERLLAMEGDREANYQLAFSYMIIDDTASMRAVDDKAKALFPSSPETAWGYHARRALVHVYRGDSLAARREVAAYSKAAEFPHETLMLAGAIELALGSLESARAYLDSAGVFYGNDSTLVYKTEPEELIEGWYRVTSLAFILGKRGEHERARELLAQQARYDSATLARLWMDDGVRYDLGVVTLLQGDRDGAVRHIARAIEEGYTLHRWIAFDPRLEALHDDPRCTTILASRSSSPAPSGEPIRCAPS